MKNIALRFVVFLLLFSSVGFTSATALADDKPADKAGEKPAEKPVEKAPEKTTVSPTPWLTPTASPSASPSASPEKATPPAVTPTPSPTLAPSATPTPVPAPAKATPEFDKNKIVVGYFSMDKQEDFDKKVKPLFDQFKGNCKNCEMVNLTPYDANGSYAEKDLLEKVKNPPPYMTFYFFSWNKKATDQYKDLVAALSEKIESGKLVVSPTGHSVEGEPGLSLSRTVMGKAKDVVIIGEITGNERIMPQSYFGPEMMTAIRPPKDYLGQGWSPLYFAARLAGVWNKRKPAEWIEHFKMKKVKSRKIWPDVDDLLGR